MSDLPGVTIVDFLLIAAYALGVVCAFAAFTSWADRRD